MITTIAGITGSLRRGSVNRLLQAAAREREILTVAGASVIGTGLAVPRAFAQFTPEGQLADPGRRRQLHEVTGELIRAAADRRQAALPPAPPGPPRKAEKS